MMFRCRTADNVTWLGEETSRFQFHLSHELIVKAAFVKIFCDVSLCRHDSDSGAAAGRLGGGDAMPQV